MVPPCPATPGGQLLLLGSLGLANCSRPCCATAVPDANVLHIERTEEQPDPATGLLAREWECAHTLGIPRPGQEILLVYNEDPDAPAYTCVCAPGGSGVKVRMALRWRGRSGAEQLPPLSSMQDYPGRGTPATPSPAACWAMSSPSARGKRPEWGDRQAQRRPLSRQPSAGGLPPRSLGAALCLAAANQGSPKKQRLSYNNGEGASLRPAGGHKRTRGSTGWSDCASPQLALLACAQAAEVPPPGPPSKKRTPTRATGGATCDKGAAGRTTHGSVGGGGLTIRADTAGLPNSGVGSSARDKPASSCGTQARSVPRRGTARGAKTAAGSWSQSCALRAPRGTSGGTCSHSSSSRALDLTATSASAHHIDLTGDGAVGEHPQHLPEAARPPPGAWAASSAPRQLPLGPFAHGEREVYVASTLCTAESSHSFGKLILLQADFCRMAVGRHLNDELINAFFWLLQQQARGCGAKMYFQSCFLYSQLMGVQTDTAHRGVELGYNYENVQSWTRRADVDIFALNSMFIPVHKRTGCATSDHWMLVEVHFASRKIILYDSAGGADRQILSNIEHYLKDEWVNRKGSLPYTYEWSHKVARSPRQGNSSDCGVFTCCACMCRTMGISLRFGQEHMEQLRARLLRCLLHKSLRPLGGAGPAPPPGSSQRRLTGTGAVGLPRATVAPLSGGLPNITNSCFLNAILQCLWHLPGLLEATARVGSVASRPTVQLLNDIRRWSLQECRTLVEEEGLKAALRSLRRSLHGNSHVVGRQQDAHEMLGLLLVLLHGETRDVDGNSNISRASHHEQRRTRTCNSCKAAAEEEAKRCWYLVLQPEPSLLGSIQKFSTASAIADFYCSNCGRRGAATVQDHLISLPRILVIQLQRTGYIPNPRNKKGAGTNTRECCEVEVPLDCVDMAVLMPGSSGDGSIHTTSWGYASTSG